MTKPNQEALEALNVLAKHLPALYGDAYCEVAKAKETIRQALLQEGEPVAEIVNRFGDPEAFAERELRVLADIQALQIGTKLYAAPIRADVVEWRFRSTANGQWYRTCDPEVAQIAREKGDEVEELNAAPPSAQGK